MTCPNHMDRTVYSKGLCRSCYEKDLRQRNPEFAARQRQNRLAWGDRTPAERAAHRQATEARRARRRVDPAVAEQKRVLRRLREAKLKSWKRYKITQAQLETLTQEQGGVCAICGKRPQRGLYIDHDHVTGAVRGLLCPGCNMGLGYLGDTAEGLSRALRYLQRKQPKCLRK